MLYTICIATAALMGVAAFANGTIMLTSPMEWYFPVPGVTTTGPYNQRFIRDIGLVFLFVGAAFTLGAARPRYRVILWAAPTLWLSAHALFHVWAASILAAAAIPAFPLIEGTASFVNF
jgi:hypothetical protein